MKICMITDTYHPLFDGIVRYLDYLIPQLIAKGHEVTVVCPWFVGTAHYESPSAGFEIVRTMTSHILMNSYYWAFPDWRLIRAIKRADIVVVHSLMPLGTFGSFLSKILRKKVGFFCHHDERVILRQILNVPSLPARYVITLIGEYYKRVVDVFFHATERFRQKLITFGAPADKLHHTPFAIDTSSFHPKPTFPIRERHGIPSDAFVACYLGRLSVEKNIGTILAALDLAMAELPNLYALIVGGGADKDYYSRLPRQHPDRFIFTGFVPEAELQSYYSSSDLFVTASFNESSCFTVFEAMACSVPVILAEREHDPEIIDMENALLVKDILNPQEIKEKILFLAIEEEHRQRIGQNGQQLIKSRTWASHADRFLAGLQAAYSLEKREKTFHLLKNDLVRKVKSRREKFKTNLKKRIRS